MPRVVLGEVVVGELDQPPARDDPIAHDRRLDLHSSELECLRVVQQRSRHLQPLPLVVAGEPAALKARDREIGVVDLGRVGELAAIGGWTVRGIGDARPGQRRHGEG